MREHQRADRLHYAYLRSGVSHNYPFKPRVIPGTTLLQIDGDGYLAVNEQGELILRPNDTDEIRLPTTYCYRATDDVDYAVHELKVSLVRDHLIEKSPGTAKLFHPWIDYAPSIEMLDRYFQLLYHPEFNIRRRRR